ncbi:hypothetical protein PPYR_10762 [Photinus pyralis]|uniref:Fatty acid synthase n=1 Tax=Photinus pyralis TaxID=7054 RepID=A0A5N4AHB3_PHOPY|nr:fatty acid synthase-like [Photinus pyralis]KAB0796701.1 hypothetical protein PPYR_10762 [Photinus pyralis]
MPLEREVYHSQEPGEDEVVISGISGRFPECENMEELKRNLLDGVDMVTEDDRRWPVNMHGLPGRMGKLKNLEHFDAEFFGVHSKMAEDMDVQLRILLEVVYEAIVDAGYNPSELRGKRVAVFVGACVTDTGEYVRQAADRVSPYSITGTPLCMLSNRTSYTFDFKGPSYTIDSACSSSMVAFQKAFIAIKSGDCDAAIVGGVNTCLNPVLSVAFQRFNMLSKIGKCNAFDQTGDGYVRAEAAVALLLQRTRNARRVYATVLGAKLNMDGYKDQGITYPSGEMQKELIEDVCTEAGVNPANVVFVESHGTGTPAGDPEEMKAIAAVFLKNRSEPLLIGSVKSNLGHSEGASGLCGIAKVIIAMNCGVISKNLHYSSPNINIPALRDKRVKIVTENRSWNGGLVGINSFGFGGLNGHALLRSHSKTKKTGTVASLPRLVVVSGRTHDAVCKFLDSLDQNKEDIELMALVNSIHSRNVTGHRFRGYRLLGKTNAQDIVSYESSKRPIWYVFSGVGSQWHQMAKTMMVFDVFRKSIEKSAESLRCYGITLNDIVLNSSNNPENDILMTFVTINAVQIALTDLLTSLGIVPEGIIGHSAGEVACAYADGSMTHEETIRTAYIRSITIYKECAANGAMAAIGLSWEECIKRCPPEIQIACHNSIDNVTVSGPKELVSKLVADAESSGIFAKMVPSSGYAFHSKYVAPVKNALQKALDEIIPHPKPRSAKWISTSYPESKWDSPDSKLCSAKYHVTNVLSPVLFYEALQHVPKNAIVIEIAPHGLLQAIVRRVLDSNCTSINLMSKTAPNNVDFCLSAIGRIFNAGGQPQISTMYEQVKYPVGCKTTMINSMIEWDHSEKWNVINSAAQSSKSGECIFKVDLSKESDKFLIGHQLDGRIIFPGAGYLIFAWKALAKLNNEDFEKMPVVFEDVEFKRPIMVSEEGSLKLSVNILESSGEFEICEGGYLVSSGRIFAPRDISKETVDLIQDVDTSEPELLQHTSDDFYKELKVRGYDYSGHFKVIMSSDNRGMNGRITCQSNWITYTDAVLQYVIFGSKSRELSLPVRIQRVLINPKLHRALMDTNDSLPIKMFPLIGLAQTGGIEMHKVEYQMTPRRTGFSSPNLESYKFVAYDNADLTNDISMGREHAVTILTQIVLENTNALKLKVTGILQEAFKKDHLTLLIKTAIESEPKMSLDYTVIKLVETDTSELENNEIQILPKMVNKLKENTHLVVMKGAFSQKNEDLMKAACASLKPGGFILSEEEDKLENVEVIASLGLRAIATQSVSTKSFLLLRKPLVAPDDVVVLKITEANFDWLEPLKHALQKSESEGIKIYLVSQGEELNGLMGMVNCLKREPGGINIRAYYMPNETKEVFSLSSSFYRKQLEKDLVHNVLKNTAWGSYRHLPINAFKEENVAANHAYINVGTKGDLSTLRWVKDSHKLDNNSELCSVYYAPINFRDVMLATGQLATDALPGNYDTNDCPLGLEFSGRDSKGRRVMGVVKSRGLALTCVAHPKFLLEVPEKWTLEEAATVPVVYGTVYYALIIRGQLQPGESVLIHSGAGGVGQAAISVALSMGCTVFTTVGSQLKRNFIKNSFPQLDDQHIGNSRDSSFERFILFQTKGRGVDVVLNSLSGKLLQASVRCLAMGGRFLEIGKVDLFDNSNLGMHMFLKDTSFHGILFDAIIEQDNSHTNRILQLMREGIASGAVRPLPSVVFDENQAEEAFRLMASGNHIGKIVLKIRSEEQRKVCMPSPKSINSATVTYMDPKKSYVLVGGLGGFGLELANWLICRGATKVLLNSRSGVTTGYQSMCVRRWRNDGVNIVISKTDATTERGANQLVKEAAQLGPVGGIFNLAAVLRDSMIMNMSKDDFKVACLPKVQATKYLDAATRALAPYLDHFVVFSSISCGRGNAGQANYGFANSVMERICESRQADNLPGLAIQWGPIDDVGLLTKMDLSVDVMGLLPQRINSCLMVMDTFLNQPHVIVGSMILGKSVKMDKKTGVADVVAKIMGIKDLKTVAPTATLSDLGMDSLMGSEIKESLERNFDINLNVKEIRGLTFDHLSQLNSTA